MGPPMSRAVATLTGRRVTGSKKLKHRVVTIRLPTPSEAERLPCYFLIWQKEITGIRIHSLHTIVVDLQYQFTNRNDLAAIGRYVFVL